MQTDLLLKIAGVGVMTTVVSTILARTGREELGTLSTVAGLAIVLLMVVEKLSVLFQSVAGIFHLY